ncbi:MAG: SOS response-associated peptidase [Balneolales bacterium]
MCGRYTLYSNKKAIENQFDVEIPDDMLLTPRYNITPGSNTPVVLTEGTSDRIINTLKWGLTISENEKRTGTSSRTQIDDQSLFQNSVLRKLFQRRRCIIPANGFYEWKDFGDHKLPFYIRLLDQEIFGMAGIYDISIDKNGNKVKTFAILTTTANALIQPLHEQMPVILLKKDYTYWLDPVQSQSEPISSLLQPYPTEYMSAFKVSSDVNNPELDQPELINPKLR